MRDSFRKRETVQTRELNYSRCGLCARLGEKANKRLDVVGTRHFYVAVVLNVEKA